MNSISFNDILSKNLNNKTSLYSSNSMSNKSFFGNRTIDVNKYRSTRPTLQERKSVKPQVKQVPLKEASTYNSMKNKDSKSLIYGKSDKFYISPENTIPTIKIESFETYKKRFEKDEKCMEQKDIDNANMIADRIRKINENIERTVILSISDSELKNIRGIVEDEDYSVCLEYYKKLQKSYIDHLKSGNKSDELKNEIYKLEMWFTMIIEPQPLRQDECRRWAEREMSKFNNGYTHYCDNSFKKFLSGIDRNQKVLSYVKELLLKLDIKQFLVYK